MLTHRIIGLHKIEVDMKLEQKEIYNLMSLKGLFAYGQILPQAQIHELFEIKVPQKATFKEFQEVQLKELAVIGYIRDQLIKDGKYLKKDGVNYKVLLPSENANQADLMLESAKRKTRRASTLLRCTPKQVTETATSDSSHRLERCLERIERHNKLVA